MYQRQIVGRDRSERAPDVDEKHRLQKHLPEGVRVGVRVRVSS